ncbi:MAG: hypothetical protein RI637_04535 [Acidimicrobiia bacterium]|nr:hypothetical protein [Acidimicrobiia bacterium]
MKTVTVWRYIMFWAKNRPFPEWTIDFGVRSPVMVATSSRRSVSAAGSGIVVVVVVVVIVVVVVEEDVVVGGAAVVTGAMEPVVVAGFGSSALVAEHAPRSKSPATQKVRGSFPIMPAA